MNWRLLLGAMVAVGGIVLAYAPGANAGLSTSPTLLTLVGIGTGVLAYWRGGKRRYVDVETADIPVVESPREFPRPGASFDDRIQSAVRGRHASALRTEIRDRLHENVVDALTRAHGLSIEEARTAIDRGTWTDDPYATAFFTRRPPEISAARRARHMVSGTSPYRRKLEHVTAELDELTEEH